MASVGFGTVDGSPSWGVGTEFNSRAVVGGDPLCHPSGPGLSGCTMFAICGFAITDAGAGGSGVMVSGGDLGGGVDISTGRSQPAVVEPLVWVSGGLCRFEGPRAVV